MWKEVDGIFTADPRKVPTARLLSTITPAEAAELTFYGSEVRGPLYAAVRTDASYKLKFSLGHPPLYYGAGRSC